MGRYRNSDKGGKLVTIEHLTRALLSAMAILEDLARSGQDSHAAVNALEGIGYELGQMSSDERREFVELLDRIAAAGSPEQAEWIRSVPQELGLDQEF
jgi:hypothetical protein